MRASAPDAAGAQPFRWEVLRDGTAEAARAAAEAGPCMLVLGNDPLINGRENQDRATLALPPAQDRLIRAVHAACPRLVLVVMSSYPYALGWAADHVPAIVWTSHGGQETGRALAGLLLGTHEPAGRLAQTWYAADEDLPGLLDYDIIKTRRTYLYFDGCPLYPFGHGLSYTTFGYSGLRLDPPDVGPDDVLTVSVEVTNTGTRAGTEVVQCYTGPVAPRRPRPRGALAGFTRLSLAPGETGTARLPVPVSALGYWDVAACRMTVDPGDYLVKVGSSSAAIRQSGWLRVRGPAPPPRPVRGTWVRAADFDDYDGITLVDESRERGDAVTPAGPAPGWIQFRETDLGSGPQTLTVRVARDEPAPATVALHAGAEGELLGRLGVPLDRQPLRVHRGQPRPAGPGCAQRQQPWRQQPGGNLAGPTCTWCWTARCGWPRSGWTPGRRSELRPLVRRRLQPGTVGRAGLGGRRRADACGPGEHGHGRRVRAGPGWNRR